jgi:uncharacterized protein (TIGR02217 family)
VIEKQTLTPVEANSIQQVFESTKGGRYYFFYTDKSDYIATHAERHVGGTAYTQGLVVYSNGFHILTKRYSWAGGHHFRIIGAARNITIYDYTNNNAIMGNWGYQYHTGLVTGLPGEHWYLADFEFDVPVRFAEDTVDLIVKTKQVYPLYSSQIKLIEQKLSWPTVFNDTFQDYYGQELLVDMLFNSTITRKFNTVVLDLSSGFTKTDSYQPTAISEVTLGERQALSSDNLEYLLCLWLNVKGSGAFWLFRDVSTINNPNGSPEWAAFRDNALSYTLKSPVPKQYAVSSLTARVFYEGIHISDKYGWNGSVLTLADCVFFQV